MKLGMYIAYIETKAGIDFGRAGVKVKVTVTKNRKTVSGQ